MGIIKFSHHTFLALNTGTKVLKMNHNGYTFWGSNFNIFFLASLLNRGTTLKGKNLLPVEANSFL